MRSIGQLYEQNKNEFLTLLKSELAVPLLDYLFKKPVFYVPDVHRTLGINRVRAAKYIGILREAGIFQEIEPATGRQGAFLALDALFEITDQQ